MVKYKDIAERCSVSTATVSYVLNGKGSVSPAVRQLVLQTAREMGYEGRSSAGRNHRVLRLYCSDLETLPTHMFLNELLTGIFSVTQERGYDVIVTPTPRATDNQSLIPFSSQMLGDGILIINPRDNNQFLEAVRKSHVPCLIIGRPGDGDDDFCYVDADNVAVGYRMTRHVLDHGHREILFVNPPQEYTISQDRLSGYKIALEEWGIPFDPEQVIQCGFTVDDARQALSDYLDTHPLPSAVIANSDTQAVGILEALNERKLRVPRDCSMICGGEGILVRMQSTPITGVDLHHTELGRRAAQMMLNLIEKTLIRATQYHVSFDLNDRGSVVRKK